MEVLLEARADPAVRSDMGASPWQTAHSVFGGCVPEALGALLRTDPEQC